MRWAVLVVLVAACGGDDVTSEILDAGPTGPAIALPELIALPYVEAGAGASMIDVPVTNTGDGEAHPLWGLTGPGFTLVSAPDVLAGGATAQLTIAWEGSAVEAIAGAALTLEGDVTGAVEVWAVAGDPALGDPDFEPVMNPGGVTIGDSAVIAMPTAPYDADPRVHVFVPEGYRQADAHDLVLHFHGHSTTIDATVPAHRYREQVYASGANVILVVPQGPVNLASGDFGRLMDPASTAVFLDEVLIALYRAGVISRPVLGDLILTSHSGGYAAVAANLDGSLPVRQVQLYDSLYGYLPTYRAYVNAGGRLRSNYTSTGGTDANNLTLASQLATDGFTVIDEPTQRALRDEPVVIYPTAATHNGSTRDDAAYAEQLRWGARLHRDGGRVELRTASVDGVTWLAPEDPDVSDRAVVDDAGRVHVEPGASDTYYAGDSDVLVVDGFDRVVDGSYGELSHDFAARVAEAAGGAEAVSNEAITEDGFALAPYRVVIWLVGDDSTDDHTFTAAERAAIQTYVDGGGHVILSGSEIGYELGATASAWLSSVTGASYASDDAGTTTAMGASIAAFDFGVVYPEEYPDTFTGGTTLLSYSTGGAAAVGISGRGAIVGFPLETIGDDDALADVVGALITFVE